MSKKSKRSKLLALAASPAGARTPQSVPPRERASPTRDDIALRAREMWEVKGCPAGHDLDIWLSAERELVAGVS